MTTTLVVSMNGLLGRSGLSEAADRAGGNDAQTRADRADTAITRLAGEVRATATDRRLTQTGKDAAAQAFAGAAYTAVAEIYGAPSRELISRLQTVRERAGLTRRLNPNDLPLGDSFVNLDVANRVELVRTELLAMDASLLGAVIRDAFDGESPDALTAYAADTLPPFLRARIEALGLVSLDDLRTAFLERRNPEAAASVQAVEELLERAHADIVASRSALETALGALSPEGHASLDRVLGPIREALGVD